MSTLSRARRFIESNTLHVVCVRSQSSIIRNAANQFFFGTGPGLEFGFQDRKHESRIWCSFKHWWACFRHSCIQSAGGSQILDLRSQNHDFVSQTRIWLPQSQFPNPGFGYPIHMRCLMTFVPRCRWISWDPGILRGIPGIAIF